MNYATHILNVIVYAPAFQAWLKLVLHSLAQVHVTVRQGVTVFFQVLQGQLFSHLVNMGGVSQTPYQAKIHARVEIRGHGSSSTFYCTKWESGTNEHRVLGMHFRIGGSWASWAMPLSCPHPVVQLKFQLWILSTCPSPLQEDLYNKTSTTLVLRCPKEKFISPLN